jgi:hypothetical protein
MNDATPEQVAASERAMDRLDSLADAWAIEIGLPQLIKAATSPMGLRASAPEAVRTHFRGRMESQIDAIVRQAFIEAYMRAGDSRKEYDEIQMSKIRDERDELQQLFDLQWKADQRAIKRWQAAHPGNDLVWPDRADMVVWLMEQQERLRAALSELHAMVWGECSSLLNEDSGGTARLDLEIRELIGNQQKAGTE